MVDVPSRTERVLRLAWLGVRQLIGARLYVAVFASAVVLLLAALAFAQLAGGEEARITVDLGTAFISLVVVVVSVLCTALLVSIDLKSGALHTVLARPVGRAEVIVARFVSVVFVVWCTAVALGGCLGLLVAGLGGGSPLSAAAAGALSGLEGTVVASLAFCFAAVASTATATTATFLLVVIGRLGHDLADLAQRGKLGSIGPVIDAALIVLPQLYRFDFTLAGRSGVWDFASLAVQIAYGVTYSVALIILTCVAFERRDL